MVDAVLRWQGSINGTTFTSLPTTGAGTGMMYRANNSTATDTSNPIVIPGAGTAYAWEKKCRIYIATNASSNNISNLKFYVSSTNMGTGTNQYCGFTAATTVPTSSNSSVATVEVTTSGTLTTWTGVTPTTGATTIIGNYVHFQLDVGTSGVHGSQTDITYTCQYDEV